MQSSSCKIKKGFCLPVTLVVSKSIVKTAHQLIESSQQCFWTQLFCAKRLGSFVPPCFMWETVKNNQVQCQEIGPVVRKYIGGCRQNVTESKYHELTHLKTHYRFILVLFYSPKSNIFVIKFYNTWLLRTTYVCLFISIICSTFNLILVLAI